MKKMYVVIKQTVMEGVDMLHVEMMSENLEDCKKYLDDLAEQNDGKCGMQRYSDSVDSYDTLALYLSYKESTSQKYLYREIYKVL